MTELGRIRRSNRYRAIAKARLTDKQCRQRFGFYNPDLKFLAFKVLINAALATRKNRMSE